jgi:maleate isomerase
VRNNTPDSAEAVYIGGNGLRAVGIIQALEEELQRPVLTANQVLFWNLLRLARTRVAVTTYGRLFALELPA